MANPALGVRRRCAACEAPFYDLSREPIVCPKCGAPFVPEPPVKRRPSRAVRFRTNGGAAHPRDNVIQADLRPEAATASVDEAADVETVPEEDEEEIDEPVAEIDEEEDAPARSKPV